MDIKVLYRLYNIVHLAGRHDVGRERITPKSTPSDTNSLVTLVDIILRVGAPFQLKLTMKKGDYSQNYVDLTILSYYIVNNNVPGSLPPTPSTQNTQRACPRLVSPGRNGN